MIIFLHLIFSFFFKKVSYIPIMIFKVGFIFKQRKMRVFYEFTHQESIYIDLSINRFVQQHIGLIYLHKWWSETKTYFGIAFFLSRREKLRVGRSVMYFFLKTRLLPAVSFLRFMRVWVTCFSFVGYIGYESWISINVISNLLEATVWELDVVWSLGFITITRFLLSEIIAWVFVFYGPVKVVFSFSRFSWFLKKKLG